MARRDVSEGESRRPHSPHIHPLYVAYNMRFLRRRHFLPPLSLSYANVRNHFSSGHNQPRKQEAGPAQEARRVESRAIVPKSSATKLLFLVFSDIAS